MRHRSARQVVAICGEMWGLQIGPGRQVGPRPCVGCRLGQLASVRIEIGAKTPWSEMQPGRLNAIFIFLMGA